MTTSASWSSTSVFVFLHSTEGDTWEELQALTPSDIFYVYFVKECGTFLLVLGTGQNFTTNGIAILDVLDLHGLVYCPCQATYSLLAYAILHSNQPFLPTHVDKREVDRKSIAN